MVGDMFNFNEDYKKLNLSQINEMKANTTNYPRQKACPAKKENFLEVFKDRTPDVSIEQIGPAFCDTLNGKLVPMPGTLEKFEKVQSIVQDFLAVKGGGLLLVLSGYVLSPEVTFPMLGYPPGGYYQEFREIGTDKMLTINEEIMKTAYYFKEKHAFQKPEKLCVMMGLHSSLINETLYLTCSSVSEAAANNPAAICLFKKKINVKVSGLCTQSPVDKSYTLLGPKKYDNEMKNGYFDNYRYGTFSGQHYHYPFRSEFSLILIG